MLQNALQIDIDNGHLRVPGSNPGTGWTNYIVPGPKTMGTYQVDDGLSTGCDIDIDIDNVIDIVE